MQSGRLNAEEKVRQLTGENKQKTARIEAMIADYEAMKNELLENNALKDNYIDSLNKVAFELNEQLAEKQESLQETSFTLDFEKQRLTETLENKNQVIKQLEAQVNRLENDITDRSSLIDQKNYDISLLQDKVKQLQGESEKEADNLKRLNSQIANLKKETDQLKSQLKEKDENITRLENNVKLLKKELGQN
jgi:chromosome segregation ATPase